MRSYLWIGIAVLALALLASPAVFAGKGNGKGKPGGGDDGGSGGGSDVTALHELVFIAQVALDGNTGRVVNCGDLVSCNVDGTGLTRLTEDQRVAYSHMTFDAQGDVLGYMGANALGYPGYNALSPETGDSASVDSNGAYGIFTRRKDSTGAIRTWDEQYVVLQLTTEKGPRNPVGQLPLIRDVAMRSTDGTSQINLTDFQNAWDEDASVYTWTNADSIVFIPQQDASNADADEDRAWIYYVHHEEDWYYDDPAADGDGSYGVIPSTIQRVWHRITLDTADWDTREPSADDVLSDVALGDAGVDDALPWSNGFVASNPAETVASITANGRYAAINRDGAAYVVELDYSNGYPEVPEPTSSDLVDVTIPSGWEDEVEVRAISDDGQLVALNLFLVETVGKGKRATSVLRRHLFVANAGGSDLLQIDIDTADVEFEYAYDFDVSFTGAAFRPAAD